MTEDTTVGQSVPGLDADTVSGSLVKTGVTQTSKLEAGAAGAGAGTLLVVLANNLPPTNSWKPWLIILAPSVSVLLSVSFALLRSYIDTIIKQRRLRRLILRTQEKLKFAIDNPATSDQTKAKLRREFDDLQLLLVRSDVSKIKALSVEVDT